jgi:periplasmic divalent cation tolerance protein
MVDGESSAVVVLVAAGSQQEARTIARVAVERKLAACAQILPIQSVYEWEGKIEEDAEYLVLLKTQRAAYQELEACVNEQHSYEVPEILALPIAAGLEAYMTWMAGVVAGRDGQ